MQTHIIENGIIINTIMATVDETAEAYPDYEIVDAARGGSIGDQIVDGIVIPAPPPSPPLPLPHITKLAFRNRFSTGEKVLIDLASIDDPNAPMPARQQAAAVRVSLADAAAASYIDLSREDTRAGVLMLETAGILGVGRALQILDDEISDSERAQ